MFWFSKIHDLLAHRDQVAQGRYGVIETRHGEFHSLELRPLPKLISWPEVWPVRLKFHARGPQDRCRLYFNQPRGMANFLALKYIVSTDGTRYATFRAALAALDQVAAIKRTDAIVCDAANVRLSDRLMQRWGWEPHKPQRWHRNFIRRFYGEYPAGCLPA
ncbi:hypothetical protein NG895_27610 [Aeoliella sp. ICT_H6.2]|uniref:Uncharacterized protein n=1 Tax=Aeoliella straminimaris TaxID=2954799 RepID=A0A9X2FG48_9BACT|nr:hypothetical protein [Aeoliella straminimaris]MCO6047688.1 hypothetical protein [Aeoliella straminimaris]